MEAADHTARDEKVVRIVYTNYRNETAIRAIIPERIWYGSTTWHPQEQWLLDAFDIEKGERRSFALADIRTWLK
jgi:predicted DNA-binding transcriptional regulator YafY